MDDLLGELMPAWQGAVLDVGANVGQTLIKVKAIEAGREYVGFEPNPACVYYARELIKANGFENCTIIPVGLFTDDRVLGLDHYKTTVTDPSASMVPDFRRNARVYDTIYVPVFSYAKVANLIEGLRASIIKIDVEGAELEVVKSLAPVIQRDRPVIIIEILPVNSDQNITLKLRSEEIEALFADSRYVMHKVERTENDCLASLNRLEKLPLHSHWRDCNYVMVPSERLYDFRV